MHTHWTQLYKLRSYHMLLPAITCMLPSSPTFIEWYLNLVRRHFLKCFFFFPPFSMILSPSPPPASLAALVQFPLLTFLPPQWLLKPTTQSWAKLQFKGTVSPQCWPHFRYQPQGQGPQRTPTSDWLQIWRFALTPQNWQFARTIHRIQKTAVITITVLYNKRIQIRTSQMKTIERGQKRILSTKFLSFFPRGIRTCHSLGISICDNTEYCQPGKFNWTSVPRTFIGILLYRYGWLNHWLKGWISGSWASIMKLKISTFYHMVGLPDMAQTYYLVSTDHLEAHYVSFN